MARSKSKQKRKRVDRRTRLKQHRKKLKRRIAELKGKKT